MTRLRPTTELREETHEWFDNHRKALQQHAVLDLDDRLRAVEERLLIIGPSPEALAKYPALAEAYREYKLIERLVLGNDQT
jgi:hypothetical protein